MADNPQPPNNLQQHIKEVSSLRTTMVDPHLPDIAGGEQQGGIISNTDNQYVQNLVKSATETLQSAMQINQSIYRAYQALFLMYCTLFGVGVLTAIAAIIKGFLAQNGTQAIPSLIFAGLSASSFITLFIFRPLESIERNAIFFPWLTSSMNNYWIRMMYFNDEKTINTDIKDAGDELMSNLDTLADKYATAIGRYQAPTATDASATPTPTPTPQNAHKPE